MLSPRIALACALALGAIPSALAQDTQRLRTDKVEVIVETLARNLENPWGLAFLPDSRMLVTERPGRLRTIDADGTISEPIRGLPKIAARGQGGLLDVALDPIFAQNRLVYLSFAEDRGEGRSGTTVARGRLNQDGTALKETQVIFRQEPAHTGNNHWGSRLVFDRDGNLFVTLGDRFDLRDQAQNPANHIGKIVHIKPEGGAAPGNPFLNRGDTRPEIWSLGHRNLQSAALHPITGELWTVEHGARGGDELNIPQKGKNYGWPVISYGVDYSGAKIGEGTKKEGLEQPVFYWDPSIAPSGMAFYTGDQFPAWRGSILVGALSGKLVSRLETDGNRVTGEERMLQQLGERIRDVRQGPDGLVYLLTDSRNGRILRMKPAT
ncbi:PQQ-dependent sugar dehydrogenase [Microvirga lotononidis]|uniref:Glucose/sorbosone dehydrogenase n=1 Tax=Microvirga lotononidis TaxID=864069 RepID=I4YPL8_9HYPH|nr:PQQ-dependent sugar dehydrogenase [Microvirga lotononidis]EIM25910.1 glucose/sorbosone dehydrogenase [Microvirga lotononidis]WQO25824.1 PQQ-dependent sugar dehydrogenase [Microvirga lotononidis]